MTSITTIITIITILTIIMIITIITTIKIIQLSEKCCSKLNDERVLLASSDVHYVARC